jgi:regulatory protein
MPKADGQKPRARRPDPEIRSAYVTGLTMLGRRELSESQVRQRLARKGYEADEIDGAIERLKSERAIDDARVAGAIARTQTSVRGKGKRRVAQELDRAGIASATAHQALDATFSDLDDESLLAAALNRRLKDDRPIADDREFRRLYRYLIGQGFESDKVFRILSARRNPRSE